MDPIFLGLLAKVGVDTVVNIIAAWKRSGEPTEDDIRAARITKTPEEYFDEAGLAPKSDR